MIHRPDDASLPTHTKAILFDAGQTLIHPVKTVEHIYATHAQSSGIPLEELVPQIRYHFGALFDEARVEMASGADGYDASDEADHAMWQRICLSVAERIPGLTPDPQQWFEDLYAHFGKPSTWRPFEDVVTTLSALHERGLRIGIVSNWDSRLLRIVEGLDLGAPLEAVVVSAHVGVRKPGPRIFEIALESLGVSPDETLMVGDSLTDDVQGATGVGITGVLIHREPEPPPPGQLAIDTLADLLDFPSLPSASD